ncbi:MAG: hypothetical protein KIT84_39075 [Labilithrix sp.]|nr:hypothetical protein [Labilithrix sp.]MCW5817065.1 hypothetical protein [Labilithrix sp.]
MRSVVGLVFLAACGGSVGSTFSPDASTSSSSSTSGGGDPTCTTSRLELSRACVPGVAAPGTPLTIEVDQTEGCLPCNPSVAPCAVSIAGNQITVSVDVTSCPPASGECPAICGLGRATCELPPLAPGDFVVTIAGEAPNAQRRPRELVVAAGGSASCALGPPKSASSIEPKVYEASCEKDVDCMSIVAGDLCAPCVCPNGAIAVSDGARYASDARAAYSQCESFDAVCGPCPPQRAVCNAAKVCDIAPDL